jgi:O-methyltransferase involved in polyketide biosynthesis
VRFFRPGQERERLIGRAESIRDGYLDKFAQRRKDMSDLAAELGWRFVSHVTSGEARTPLGKLAYGFEISGAAA